MSTVSVPDLRHQSLEPDFEEIYRKHAPIVYRTAKGILGNAEDAEDVLQTIFLRLIRHDLAPDILQNLDAYLYRSAINVSIDIIHARRRYVPVDDLEQLEPIGTVSDSDRDEELHKRLFEGIAQLGSKSAEIVILRYFHDMSDAQIAKILGTSRGAIAVRLFRLRARLKKILRPALGGKT